MRYPAVMESLDERCLLASVGFETLATVDTPGSTQRIIAQGSTILVADLAGGLRTYSLADPSHPALVSVLAAGTGVTDAVVRNGLAYITAGQQLRIYDLRPAVPVLLGSSPAAGATANSLTLSGNFAFVAQGSQGLRIFDISDPRNITLAGLFDSPGTARQVIVQGSTAYLADDVRGVQILDVSDPTAPALVRTLNTGGQAVGIDISGKRLVVAAKSAGVKIYDLTLPRNPAFIALAPIPITAQATGVDLLGSTLYAATSQGVFAIDISTAQPTQLGFVSTPLGQTLRLTATPTALFLANGTFGFQDVTVTSDSFATRSGDAVSVVGTAGPDVVRVSLSAGVLTASVNGAVATFAAAGLSSLVVHGGGGSDLLDLSGVTLRASVFGGAGNDTLRGGEAADSLSGEAGNDTLLGNGGNDVLSGGAGADRLQGGAGADMLSGDDGNDALFGDAGNDTLAGGLGRDVLHGGDGNDRLLAKDGLRDTLFGDAGSDFAQVDRNLDLLQSVETVRF